MGRYSIAGGSASSIWPWRTGIASQPAPRLRVVRTLAEQLADIGIGPRDVARVILSATSTMSATPRSSRTPPGTLQAREHAAMLGPDPGRYGYLPALYERVLGQAGVAAAGGDHDLFGDGSPVILATPGQRALSTQCVDKIKTQ